MARRIILGQAHVVLIQRAGGIGAQVVQFLRADVFHTGAIGHLARLRAGLVGQGTLGRGRAALLPGFQRLPRQRPADRAIAQRIDPVGQTRIDQRLRADDRARAPGAIDDDRGIRVRRHRARAQHQFRAGGGHTARNAHRGIFIEPPRVENGNVGLLVDQRLHIGRGQAGRVAAMLDQFAKRLGVAVHILEQFKPRLAPTGQTARQRINLREPQIAQLRQRRCDKRLAIIIDHHAHILARKAPCSLGGDAAQRDLRGKQRVAQRELGLLAQVNQRDFLARDQAITNILRRHSHLERSHRLGTTLLA